MSPPGIQDLEERGAGSYVGGETGHKGIIIIKIPTRFFTS